MNPLLKSLNMDPTGSIGNLQAHDWPWVLLPTGRRGFFSIVRGDETSKGNGVSNGF